MEIDKWVVAGVILLAGFLAAVGLYWGIRDPLVARYKPGIDGEFQLGRVKTENKDFAAKPDKNGSRFESK